jgi:hypothetical protein
MAPEQREILNVRHLPGRLSVSQVAILLSLPDHDIPVMIANDLGRWIQSKTITPTSGELHVAKDDR